MNVRILKSLIFTLCFGFAYSQQLPHTDMDLHQIEKWNRAVFALTGTNEGSIDSTSGFGTALFVEYKKRHYILTARHVLVSKDNDQILTKFILMDDSSNFKKPLRVTHDHFLMNYWRGVTLSTPDIDLGIIALDRVGPENQGPNFLNFLLNQGYRPIDITDVDLSCTLASGDEIWAMGYPIESVQMVNNIPPAIAFWQSPLITRTFISRGTVNDTNPRPGIFYADVFVYHGFSGGPIIFNGKLVGIISGIDFIPISTAGNNLNQVVQVKMRISKSSNIMEWLNKAVANEDAFIKSYLPQKH
jgi:hypothetical protein